MNSSVVSTDRSVRASARQAAGERRQMTVMFCDLVGSTGIADKLDPEQMREILLKYQDASAAAIKRYGGYVAHYMGDGLLVYFGYPRAYEDAARRALFAALEVASAVAALSPEIEAKFNQRLDVRIGINTGEVVIGDMGAGEWIAPAGIVGPTPNIAARLQELAEPNAIITSQPTHDLTSGYFEFEDLGSKVLRGLADPMRVYRVLAATAAKSRIEATPALSPIAGRAAEQRLLTDRWDRAQAGETVNPLMIEGEAGIGKTRLVQIIRGRAEWSGAQSLDGYCSPYHTDTPFYAITQLIERRAGIGPADDPATRLIKLEQVVGISGGPSEAIPVVATLLGIPLDAPYQPLQLSPEAFRAHAIETFLRWVDDMRSRVPVLLIIEDLHWADDSTLALLGQLIKGGPHSRLLILFTARPGRDAYPWTEEQVTSLSLEPLDESEREEMLTRLLHGRDLPFELEQQVIERSNGVPLFLEELARTYAGRPSNAPGSVVPATLRDLLIERLEQPGVDKELAQIAATIGIDSPLALLEKVTESDEVAVLDRLAGLTSAGILERDTAATEETYSFRHALVRDAAYMSQLILQRRAVHTRIAEAMEGEPAGSVRPEILGLHFMEAERWDKAALYYTQAGNQARASGAEAEATRHFTEALRAVDKLPDGQERDDSELVLKLSRAASHVSTGGYAAPAAGDDLQSCLVICRRAGPSPTLLAALSSIWGLKTTAGVLAEASEALHEAVEAVSRPPFDELAGEVQICQGVEHFVHGRFVESLNYFRDGIRSYRALIEAGKHGFWPLPNDPAAGALAIMGTVAWILGQHDLALSCTDEGYAIAKKLSFPTGPFSECFVADYSALRSDLAGQYVGVGLHSDRVLKVSQEYGFGGFAVSARMRAIKVAALAGSPSKAADAATQFEGMLNLWRQAGAGAFVPYFLFCLAEIYLKAGLRQRALECLADGLKATEGGEHFHLAELLRLQAEIRFEIDQKAEDPVVDGLVKAIEVAREQGACSFEVRAAAALRRILPTDTAAVRSRELLQAAIDRFPAETQWAELDAARRLLEAPP